MSITEVSKAMGIKQSGVSLYIKLAHEKIRRELESQSIISPKTARGILAIPVGTLITSVLHEEAAAVTIANAAWIQRKITLCLSIFHYAKSLASNIPLAAKPSALRVFLAPILIVSAAIATVTIIHISLRTFWDTPPPPPEPLYTYVEQNAILPAVGEIIFTGDEDGPEHVNPRHAEATINNGFNVLTAHDWRITALENNDTVLFQGDGGVIESAFSQMIENGMDGHYILHITFEDEIGDILYKVSRQFTIEMT
jgi:hypothetical protein